MINAIFALPFEEQQLNSMISIAGATKAGSNPYTSDHLVCIHIGEDIRIKVAYPNEEIKQMLKPILTSAVRELYLYGNREDVTKVLLSSNPPLSYSGGAESPYFTANRRTQQ